MRVAGGASAYSYVSAYTLLCSSVRCQQRLFNIKWMGHCLPNQSDLVYLRPTRAKTSKNSFRGTLFLGCMPKTLEVIRYRYQVTPQRMGSK
ncbi:hypothetical protein BDV29DRAFT_98175 [Aspergillus leporis]|uniref:Uncharacterized protein n=1 Tax=Aspergillus leporis TaxID=41062 RepID=A0A5N5X5H6_9EURO|nr:hypothetical protein BDV29DRAFT_98175 [Aspergillus leporis]